MKVFLVCLIFLATLAYEVASSEYGNLSSENVQTSSGVVSRPGARTSASAEIPASKKAEFKNWLKTHNIKILTKEDQRRALATFLANKAEIDARNLKTGKAKKM